MVSISVCSLTKSLNANTCADYNLSVYIPNDDINPARKLRMKKAKEHGAIRVEQWRTKTTHIVVDKGIKYNNLLSHLELSELPVSTPSS